MKKIIKKFTILTLIFIVLAFGINFNSVVVNANDGCSELIMEVASNRILHQKNAYDKKYMASTTKILTAITIIENCDLDKIVTVGKNTVNVEGSSIYLQAGEKLTVRHLLYGLMLRSGNDCAETLAVHCSGSISEFSKLMNKTAKKIGAENSNFVNPHGLHDDEHYTTAFDLGLISCYAMKNKEFRQIVKTKSIKIPNTMQDYDRVLVNKNKMLNEFDGSNGIKTGFTKKAGRCLVSSCVRNGMELVCVVLNCPPMFERSKTLLSNSFNEYNMVKLIESDNVLDFVSVNNSQEKVGICVKNDVILPLNEFEKKNIKIEYEYPKQLDKPIKKEQEIGLVKIYCANSLIFEQKIYTIVNVE